MAVKFSQGKLIVKSHPHHKDIYPMLLAVHFAHTPEMKELLEVIIFQVWDQWEKDGEEAGKYTTKQLWNEYMLAPWVCARMHTNACECTPWSH